MTVSQPDPAATPHDALHIDRWTATSGSERGSRASLVISGGGHQWRAHADGNGAVDALMRAADEALAPLLEGGVALATYDVHASGPGHEAKASVNLSIRSQAQADGPLFPGRASSENVLEASVVAYVDAVNAYLVDAGVDVGSAVPAPGETTRHETDPDHRAEGKDRIMSAYNG